MKKLKKIEKFEPHIKATEAFNAHGSTIEKALHNTDVKIVEKLNQVIDQVNYLLDNRKK